jgi:hypothetical protein
MRLPDPRPLLLLGAALIVSLCMASVTAQAAGARTFDQERFDRAQHVEAVTYSGTCDQGQRIRAVNHP